MFALPLLLWKGIFTNSDYVSVALFNQHAKRLGSTVSSSVASPVIPYFSTLSRKWHDLWPNIIEHKIYSYVRISLHIWSEKFYILRRIQRDIVKNVGKSSCKIPFIFVRFKWKFPRQLFEKYWNINFHEKPSSGRRVVACGRMDGRTNGRTDR